MISEATLIIKHSAGLHARPGTLFAKTASRYQSTIMIRNLTTSGEAVSAKSIFSILTAGVKSSHQIQLIAEGEDAEEAVAVLSQLVETNFGED